MDDAVGSAPSAEEVNSALERTLASGEFAAGSRRATVPRYVVDEARSGRSDRLKETEIAIDVFGRGAEFDPLTDSIVRTEALRMRHALDTYYAGTGTDDPIRISIPKDTYVPQFERRGTGGTTRLDTSEAHRGIAISGPDEMPSAGAGNEELLRQRGNATPIVFYCGNYEESHRLARKTVSRNPNDPYGLGQPGWRPSLRGDFDEGIPYLEQAIARSVRAPPSCFQPIALERMMRGDMPGMLLAAQRA